MSNRHRRTVGIVGTTVGALLAAPLISLLASPLASADPTTDAAVGASSDVTTLGPFAIDGFTETLSYTTSPLALDNFLTETVDGSVFNLDTYFGPPGSGAFEVLLTDTGVFQLGVDSVDGSVRLIDNFLGSDFFPADPGLALLG